MTLDLNDVNFGLLQLFEDAKGKTEQQFLQENIDLITYADRVGLDGVWLAEHHFTDYGVMPSTQVFAAYLAGITERIRIGTGVVVTPFHNPVRLVEEFSFIDVLSNGRLDLGIGSGYQPQEFAGYGVDMKTKGQRFDEGLEILQQAWTTGKVDYKGEIYNFDNISPRPHPVQKPHPPIFGASFNPETIKYQAMKKLNLLFSTLLTGPEKIIEYRDILRDQGENPDDYRIGGLLFLYVAEDFDTACAEFEEPFWWYFRKFVEQIPFDRIPEEATFYRSLTGMYKGWLDMYDKGDMSFKEMVNLGPTAHSFMIGSPDQVTEKLESLMGMYPGLTDILLWTRLGGLENEKVMKSMKLFVEEVVQPARDNNAAA